MPFTYKQIKYDRVSEETELFFNRCSDYFSHTLSLLNKYSKLSFFRYLVLVTVLLSVYFVGCIIFFFEGVFNCIFKTHNRQLLYSKRSSDYKQYVNLWLPRTQRKNYITNIDSSRDMGKTILSTTDYLAKDRQVIVNAINKVRKILMTNKYTLNGFIIKSKYRKIEPDELLQFNAIGDLQAPYITQYISFGDEINNSLYVIMKKKIKFSKRLKDKKLCIKVEDGNLIPLKEELKYIMGKDVKITLVED